MPLPPKDDLSYEFVASRLIYDADTGCLCWKGGRLSGNLAGSINSLGYRKVKLVGQAYPAHRLAWLLAYGNWPSDEIDHANGDKDDNRLANLRVAGRTGNVRNAPKRKDNTSGIKGISWHKRDHRWQAQIMVNGKTIGLGYHREKETAERVYREACLKFHGEFANLGTLVRTP
jgi:hypothetical protein